MSISYLSKPLQSGVIPQQENIGLIAQVAAEKQNKYDNILGSIFAQYNNLLNLDTSANREVTEEYNGLMSEATKNLSSLAKLNLENPASIPKVESVFDPILNNTLIMEAVANTANNKKVNAAYDYWQTKKPDLYNSRNHQYSLTQMEENRNMSKEDYAKKKNVVTATEYVDRDKYVLDLLKGTDLEIDHSVTTPKGKHYVTVSGSTITEEQIKSLFPRNSKYMEQTKIDAFFNYGNSSNAELIGEINNGFNEAIINYREVNTTLSLSVSQLNTDIDNITKGKNTSEIMQKYGVVPANTTTEDFLEMLKDKLQKSSDSYKENSKAENELVLQQSNFLDGYKVNYFIDEKNGTNVLSPLGDIKLSKEQRERLATQVLYNSDASRFAKALAKNSTKIEITENPEWIAERDHLNKIEELKLAAKLKAITEGGSNTNSNTNEEGGGNTGQSATGTIFADVEYTQDETNKDIMNYEKFRSTVTELKLSKQDIEENYIKGVVPNGVPITPKVRKEVMEKYNQAKEFYNQFNNILNLEDESTISVGDAKMSFQEFKQKYAPEIAAIDADNVVNTSLKLYTDLHDQLQIYANQKYDLEQKQDHESQKVSDRHYNLVADLNNNGTIPLAPTFINSSLTTLDPKVKKWLSDRVYDKNRKDVPLTDAELQYLFYNGKNPTYRSGEFEISNDPINGFKPSEFSTFKAKYLSSIQKSIDSPQEKQFKLNKIINEEFEKMSMIEFNPQFMVLQKTSEETKNNPINKLSADFTQNVINSAFQADANSEDFNLNLYQFSKKGGAEYQSKEVTSIRIKQQGNNYFAYLYSNNVLLNNENEGYQLPEGLKNEYINILPVYRTNALLDIMERIYNYQKNPNSKIAPVAPKVEISAKGSRWVVEINGTGSYTLGRFGEPASQNEQISRNKLFNLLYGNGSSYQNAVTKMLNAIDNL